MNGVLAASHVMKGDNLGIERVFLLLIALMVNARKKNLVIQTNAKASIFSMALKHLVSKLMSSISMGSLWVCHAG